MVRRQAEGAVTRGPYREHHDSRRHTSTPSTRRVINSYSLHVSEIIISPKSKTSRKSASLRQLFCVLFPFTTSRSDQITRYPTAGAQRAYTRKCVYVRAQIPQGFPGSPSGHPFPLSLTPCPSAFIEQDVIHSSTYIMRGLCALIAGRFSLDWEFAKRIQGRTRLVPLSLPEHLLTYCMVLN